MNEPTPPRRESPGENVAWIAGAVLILLGIIFLVLNLTGLYLANWWALFILIPALGSFAAAWRAYQEAGGRFTAAVRGPAIGGLVLLALTFIFLFRLDWGRIWPIFLIIGGLAALFSALGK